MKRATIALLMLCLCVCGKAQVQTKFWGLELAQWYESLESARQKIDERCTLSYRGDDTITAIRGSFGGYDWDTITFCFYEHNKYGLYGVNFASNHQARHTANEKFNILLNALSEKYGTPRKTSDEYEDTSRLWTDDINSCMLTLMRTTSKGGEYYWYVNLTYVNDVLNSLSLKKSNDEL